MLGMSVSTAWTILVSIAFCIPGVDGTRIKSAALVTQAVLENSGQPVPDINSMMPPMPEMAYPPVVDRTKPKWRGLKDAMMNIGGGTGASVSGTGDTTLDRSLLRRMRYQDQAVMLLLLLSYLGSLLFSASLAYQQARNSSPVTYYADPRFHNLTTDCQDAEGFLEVFNQPPSDAQLQVVGLLPVSLLPAHVAEVGIAWLGQRYRVAFSFTLDLSPWLVPLGSGNPDDEHWFDGVARSDVERLRAYLENDSNDLSMVELQKNVEWKDWEELATNIKSKIRQGGFEGVVDVRRSCKEAVTVHKNKHWANFMHSRTTKVLLALSVIGWFVQQVYMWLRQWSITIECKYKVDVNINEYWDLIQDKIGADGFNHAGQVNRRMERTRERGSLQW